MFDEFLRDRARGTATPFVPFDPAADYNSYVDGRPRADGVRTFLASRGITLPEGEPDDPPDAADRHGLGNRKNEVAAAASSAAGGVAGVPGVGALPARGPATPGCAGRSSRPAPTAPTCWPRPGSPTCSRCGSTGSSPRPSGPARQAGAGHVPGRGPPSSASSRPEAAVFEDALAGVAGRPGRRVRRAWSGSTGSGTPTTLRAHGGASIVVTRPGRTVAVEEQ